MNIGVLVTISRDQDIRSKFEQIRELDLQSCQVNIQDVSLYTDDDLAKNIRLASRESGVEISALWAGWSGPAVWNFHDGPVTLGLVPSPYRSTRLKELMAASDFAEKLGVNDIITHVGFIPENPTAPDYNGLIVAIRYLAEYMREKGQWFLFETGQETPVTLVRTIEDIGTGNLGINFDTANLILYGKANSVDAATIFGQYVRNLHCKDGEFPTDGKNLGCEKPLGQGKADILQVLKILFEKGYKGPLTIEREISGEQQIKDIILARDLLRSIANELHNGLYKRTTAE